MISCISSSAILISAGRDLCQTDNIQLASLQQKPSQSPRRPSGGLYGNLCPFPRIYFLTHSAGVLHGSDVYTTMQAHLSAGGTVRDFTGTADALPSPDLLLIKINIYYHIIISHIRLTFN